jgi:hypothetical protein
VTASRLVRWTSLVAIGSLGALALAACLDSVDREYVGDSGGDAGPTTGNDATADAPVEATPPGMDGGGGAPDGDAMVIEETAPVEASHPTDAPSDVGTTGQTYSCNGTMVSSCASCANKPVECVFCGGGGTHPGVCGPAGMYCSSSTPPSATTCTCSGGVSGNLGACPDPSQVCTFISSGIGGNWYCQTCGEPGSNNETCKGGGKCSSTTGMCN